MNNIIQIIVFGTIIITTKSLSSAVKDDSIAQCRAEQEYHRKAVFFGGGWG